MITDPTIIKNGKEIKKISLMFISEDPKLCDGCDESKKCATLHMLCGDVGIICKDCLTEIIEHF